MSTANPSSVDFGIGAKNVFAWYSILDLPATQVTMSVSPGFRFKIRREEY
ncbi:hypothetical protein [Mycobacterium sp. OTB74]|jgi:hypothetical protein|nr:hypothetical protein [Mycobacterium sp. OTB74]MDH6242647.1 hypothetical protein [Mycobacterium sp. OTB74]